MTRPWQPPLPFVIPAKPIRLGAVRSRSIPCFVICRDVFAEHPTDTPAGFDVAEDVMDQQLIKTLIDALAASDLSELEFSRDGATLRLVKQPAADGGKRATSVVTTAASVPVASALKDSAPKDSAVSAEVRAPLFGIVHLQTAPGAPPFVQAGQEVLSGQTLCVIEAMKVFNEIRAERDATVQAVLVVSGQEVDAGQPLFRLS